MKKRAILAGLVVLILAAAASAAPGADVKDVLAKMIDAQGGRTALEAVKDTTVAGNVEMIQMGVNATITMYQKEPDKMRLDIEVMGMVITQAYDGQKAWFVNPQTGATEEMPEAQAKSFKQQALGNDALLNPEKAGVSYALLPSQKIDAKEFLVVEQTLPDGHKNTLFVDPESYLVIRTKTRAPNQMGVEVDAETVFTDFRKEGDLLVAHQMTTYQDGAEFMRMSFTKYTYNAGLEDSFFAMAN
jgi:outer membrane lipoprotein-sorting protein